MMQDASRENLKDSSEVRTVEINEGNLTPLQAVEKAHVIPTQSNFGPDMSGSDDDEASEVDSFILDENEMDGSEEVLETSKFLLAAETEEGQQQLQTVDPETHARLEALLEAAGISKLSSKDGKALTDPEVLRTLTSSVSSALDEATQAINCMRSEQQGLGQGIEGGQLQNERDTGTVRKLYESGRVPDTTEDGESLLSLACSAGYYELAQVLLAMNANVEDRGIKGDCTPLMEAASGGFVDIVRLLILHGADVNAQSSAGNTPLHSAACAGHTSVVKELIGNGALAEVHNENGHTPLMEAASAGHVEIAQQLLEAGAGINTHSNEFKESALTLACYKGHLEMVKYLLDAGADQEHKTDEMHTALMEASMDGHVEVARLLLDSGAQVNMPVDSFESPLTLAACGGHVELANLLIERGANIEEVNDEGYTPLMEAAREGHGEMVALLLSHGADINTQTEETQETALTLACCGGFKEVAEFLIKAGANLELGCSTPLMEAAQEGHLELVDFLLKESANVHAQTGTHDTALTYACENGHTDVAIKLLSHGGYLEHESEGGRTPLMKAARAGHLCTVKHLIKQGADVNRSTSTNDHTVLSLACAGGHHQVVEELLNNGADPNHKLKDGSTMIIEAAKGGHVSVVKLLLEWPNRMMLSSSMDLAQPDLPHVNMVQGALEEPRVPVQGLAHIVPPNDPDCQLPACLNFSASPGKMPERLNGGKIMGKRAAPGSVGIENKQLGKVSNSVMTENLQQINHDGTALGDPSEEKATEKVERELQDKAQQQLEHQQQLLRTRSTSIAGIAPGVQRGLTESLCVTGTPTVESGPCKDFMVQLPNLLTNVDQTSAIQSFHSDSPNPVPVLASPVVSPGLSVTQVQPPSPQFLQQPVPSTVVSNGNVIVSSSSGKGSKGRNTSGKITRTSKSSQQQPPLPPPPQQVLPSSIQLTAQSISSTVSPLALSLQAECSGDCQSQQREMPQQSQVQLSSDALQLQQQQLAALSQQHQQQQQQLQQLGFPHLTSQQQDQLLQHMLSQQVLQPPLAQPHFQQPLQQLLPQVPQPGQPAPQLLTQQERAQLFHQTHQAQLLQQQLLKQTSASVPTTAAVAAIPNPAAASPPVSAEKIQQSNLYQSSVDVDSQTESNHDTALTLACAGGHSELVSLLLAKGAEIEHRDKKGFTPLILGATAGHLEVVEILLDHAADIEAQSERTKDTPLSLACSGGRYEVVELLLARGANKEHRNVSDYTPLSLAASGGYVNIIKLLLSHGAEINSRTGSKLGISPLMLAAMNGHTQAVKLLLDMGSDINAQIETNRNTALTLACFQGRHEVVSLLVDRKANIEHRAKTGLTPLMEAASGGYVEVGRVLLDKGADVNAPPVPSSRDTALTIAADKGHYRFVELLLHRSAAVDVKNKKGNSPLWLASNGGHLDVVQLLVTAGADIDSQDNRKVSCLMAAFRKSHIKVVKWMVKHVSQFPSDTELQRYLSSVTDKELQKKGQQCMDIIVSAKDRQAAEANKNANSLLQEIDRERELDEQKRQVAAKRRERRKERKKKGKLEKTKDNKDKNSSPEPESETGPQDQDNDDEDDEDNLRIEPPAATVTSTLGTTLMVNTEAKSSRSSTAKNSANTSFSVSAVTSSTVSAHMTDFSPASSSAANEKRLQNADMRKNRRNRKEKTLQAANIVKESSASAAVISTAMMSRSSSVTTATGTAVVTSLLGNTGLHSNTEMGGCSTGGSSSSSTNSVQSSANSKRKRNDVIKPVTSGKSRVGDLDDFGSFASTKLSKTYLSTEIDRLSKNIDKVRIAASDMLNICERDSNLPAKLTPLGTSPRKGQRKDEGWKEVTRKSSKKMPDVGLAPPPADECSNCRSKMVNIPGTASDECCNCRSKKVTVPANVISRVIGRGGCNINSIRETSNAHVDIEKSQKGAVDRVVTIKGSAEATRMAHAMITSLVQEPDKDLSEIIARVKGKPAEKNQQTPVTIGDFAIGMFTIPNASSQSVNSLSQKSNTSKSGSNRQPSSASNNSAVNGRTAGNCVGVAPTNVWQNPTTGSGTPHSPRRSPQKQLPQSLVPLSSSGSVTGPEKVNRQIITGDQRRICAVTTSTASLPSGTAVSSLKSATSPALGRSGSELRQQVTPGSSMGVVGQKSACRPSSGSMRVPRQSTGMLRPDPQPLPIVSSHMSNPGSSPATSSNGITSNANFSAFHLWNNASPTPILSKKEDFASVAAAGVIPSQPNQQGGQVAPGSPAPTPNDPTKAPGYKAGIGSASPQSRQDHANMSSLMYPASVDGSEQADLYKLNSRGSASSSSSMPVLPGLPSPAGDGGHMSPHIPYPGPIHPASFPNQHASFFPQQPIYPGPGALPDQKEEYSTPHQPMTLPEIKSTLNPNAPDFQITGSGVTGPGGMVNGYPPHMADVRNGGDLPYSNGAGGARVEGGGNNGGTGTVGSMSTYLQLACAYMRNQLQNMPPAMLQQLSMGFLGNMDQNLELYYNLQRLYQPQQRSGSPGPGRAGSAPGPGPPPHLAGQDAGPGIVPGPSPGPGGPSPMSNYMAGPSLPRTVSPMPLSQHRPNSAPCMPDSAPTTPVRPNNIGSPMPSCTPPLPDGKQTSDDRKIVPRPIGMERAAQRKLPLNDPISSHGGSGDFNKMIWDAAEMAKDWMPASPQMTAAAIPTSVTTSSVVTGSNMAYTLNQRENTVQASDGMNTFQETFTNAGIDPAVDPSLQVRTWRSNWSHTDM